MLVEAKIFKSSSTWFVEGGRWGRGRYLDASITAYKHQTVGEYTLLSQGHNLHVLHTNYTLHFLLN